MRARIRYKGFDAEESEKLKPFLYIGDYFAQVWNRSVVFDAPHGQGASCDTQDEQKVIYVHFFSFSPLSSPAAKPPLGYAFDLFRFAVPHQDLTVTGQMSWATVSGNDVAARFRSVGKQNHTIVRSPESRTVAQIVRNHIFILFDLAHRPWDGAEPILWEILEQATPHVVSGSQGDSARPGLLIAAHEKLRAKSLKKTRALSAQFSVASRSLLEQEYRKTLTALRTSQLEMLNREGQMMELATEIEMLKEILKDPEKDAELSLEHLRDEFELIHRYKGLLGIKIEDGKLEIITEPIEHLRPSDDKPHLLSQYKIVIDPEAGFSNETTFPGIRMTEWGWQGPFCHPESYIKDTFGKEPKSPCFGQTFVTSIRKALLDFDFKVLIALLLHYLDSDDREPSAREERKCNSEPYKSKPFYADEAARNAACEDYINFSKKYRGKTRQRCLEEMLSEAEGKEKKIITEWREQRRLYFLLGTKAGFLRSYIDRLSVDEELKSILDIPAFMNMRIGPDFIWCVFGPGRGLADFRKVWFFGTFRVLVKISGGEVHISHGPSSEAGLLDDRFEYDGKLKYDYAFSNFRSCLAKGLYGKMFAFIHNIVRGEVFGGDADFGEDITDKKIIEFVRKNTPCLQ